MRDELIHSFTKYNCTIIEVCKGMNNFIPHFTGHVITYPCWHLCFSASEETFNKFHRACIMLGNLILGNIVLPKKAVSWVPNYASTVKPKYKRQLSRQWNCWWLRCCWSIACHCCSNYIFILHLTHDFNGLLKDYCKTRWEIFKFWDLV